MTRHLRSELLDGSAMFGCLQRVLTLSFLHGTARQETSKPLAVGVMLCQAEEEMPSKGILELQMLRHHHGSSRGHPSSRDGDSSQPTKLLPSCRTGPLTNSSFPFCRAASLKRSTISMYPKSSSETPRTLKIQVQTLEKSRCPDLWRGQVIVHV